MKFVRFGALKLQKQEQYEEPAPDMVPWSPPCKKGFFAFPAGYMDPFYLPLSRPPENPHSLLQYLRDDKGNKMTKKVLIPWELCVWPVYPKLENEYAATLKKYRMFEYEGCLWHHLGALLKRSEILSQFSDTWYYTDIHAYERALRKASGLRFGKKMKYQHQMKNIGYFGAREWNSTFDQKGMFEVFFDQRIP